MKRLISIVGVALLALVIISVAQPSLFDFLNKEQQSPLPSTTTVYAYGPNGLISKQKGTEVSYYHKDHLGSSSLTTDSSGEVVYSTDYNPFGSSLHEEGEEKYTYNSKELDSTGLYYYGARYYDASIGRFVSVDPVQGNLFNTQRLNRYSYTLNNPLKYVDPSGAEQVEPSSESAALFFPPDRYFDEVEGHEISNMHVVSTLFGQGISVDVYIFDQEGIEDLYEEASSLAWFEDVIRTVDVLGKLDFNEKIRANDEYSYKLLFGHGWNFESGGKAYLITDIGYGGFGFPMTYSEFDNWPTCYEMYNCVLSQVLRGVTLLRERYLQINARFKAPEGVRPYAFVLDLYSRGELVDYRLGEEQPYKLRVFPHEYYSQYVNQNYFSNLEN